MGQAVVVVIELTEIGTVGAECCPWPQTDLHFLVGEGDFILRKCQLSRSPNLAGIVHGFQHDSLLIVPASPG